MKYDKNLWEETIKFHGHECPGIAMGFKICEAAMKKMGINPSKDEIICIAENNTCPADAIRFILKCNEQNNKLSFNLSEDLAFSFLNKANGQTLKIQLKPLKRDKNMSKEQFTNAILEMDVDDLMVYSEAIDLF